MAHNHDVKFRKVARGGKKSSGSSHICWRCKQGLSKKRIKEGKRECFACEKKYGS
ncbi:MAG: hypothetical protein PHZ04_02745 [Patescibacteria group bacterium]|nr:hypothetical protein [Patescibacteria group bacterium]